MWVHTRRTTTYCLVFLSGRWRVAVQTSPTTMAGLVRPIDAEDTVRQISAFAPRAYDHFLGEVASAVEPYTAGGRPSGRAPDAGANALGRGLPRGCCRDRAAGGLAAGSLLL